MLLPTIAPHALAEPPAAPWRALSLQARERAYSPSSCIGGNYLPFVNAYGVQSRAAHARCVALGAQWHELRYGALPAQRMDVCVPAVAALRKQASGQSDPLGPPGLLVFIHGGYWQELSAHDSLFAAADCISRGVAFAALDYTLAPHAPVGDIVAECRAALLCLARQAARLGFDANNIVVAGSSAGAHLAAMVAWPGWQTTAGGGDGGGHDRGQSGVGTVQVRAAVLVSGIYELEPLVGTTINAALGLTATSAQAHSPALLPLAGFARSLVVWGDNETAEFKRQSQAFAAQLAAAQVPCETLEIAGRNHFDVILDLANTVAPLGRRTMALLARPG
jgi:arylformamidase